MTDLLRAAQDAIFDALNVPAVTNLAPVYQHVPDDTEPPFVKISSIAAVPIGGKGGGLDEVTVEVFSIFRGPDKTGLTRIMAAIRTALETTRLSATGAVVNFIDMPSQDAPDPDDGITYDGLQVVRVIAQPA